MTDKIKGIVEAAENAHTKRKEDRIEEAVKKIVQDTLEKIEQLEKQITKLQEEKKQLKSTIDDLKSGNLKLLKEKLDKDEKAREVVNIRIVEVIKPIWIESQPNPWYKPYEIWYGNGSGEWVSTFTANGSEIKDATLGTYCLCNGNAVTLR